MKKKYLSLFYINSFFTFFIIIFLLIYQSFSTYSDDSVYFYTEFFNIYFLLDIFLVLSFSLFYLILYLNIKKYEFKINSLLIPCIYMVFFIFILLFYIIFNNYVIIKNIHMAYYYCLLLPAYILMCLYTLSQVEFNSLKIDKRRKK